MSYDSEITKFTLEAKPGEFTDEQKVQYLKEVLDSLQDIDLSTVAGLLFVAIPKDAVNGEIHVRWAGTRTDRAACIVIAAQSADNINAAEDSHKEKHQ